MSILESFLKDLGLQGFGKARRKSQAPLLPDLDEIKSKVEGVVDSLSQLKDVPKSVMDRAVEAEEDFREADKAFRGGRTQGKKR